jgi:DNA replication protein DnaC
MTENLLLESYLKRLRLPTVAKNYVRLAEEASINKIGYEGYLSCLLELEITARDESMQRKRLRQAGFPLVKTLEQYDFSALPSLNKSLILELHRGKYLSEALNIILLGSIGTGKTHLAIALGAQACMAGKRVKFATVAALVTELLEAHDQKRLSRLKQQLSKVDLLILDELGMVPFHQDGANLLFQVINERYERRSTIITTNCPFPDWTQFFGTQNLTAALLDRLTHRCHIIEMNGESYRFKDSLRRKKKAKEAA